MLMGYGGGNGEERVRDCGSRGRIKVISINKGIKKAIYSGEEKSGKLMNGEKNNISTPNDEHCVNKM